MSHVLTSALYSKGCINIDKAEPEKRQRDASIIYNATVWLGNSSDSSMLVVAKVGKSTHILYSSGSTDTVKNNNNKKKRVVNVVLIQLFDKVQPLKCTRCTNISTYSFGVCEKLVCELIIIYIIII